jgi:hypothetical protein
MCSTTLVLRYGVSIVPGIKSDYSELLPIPTMRKKLLNFGQKMGVFEAILVQRSRNRSKSFLNYILFFVGPG